MALRLLLADDHPLIREGLKASLLDQGFSVVAEAEDGKSAVNLTLEHRPDVVVMDIGLPDLDGLEAIRRIVRARPQARVMVLTAHDDDNMRKAAHDAGAISYMVKSATTKDISDAVRAPARGAPMLSIP